jgi:hypothetical protein
MQFNATILFRMSFKCADNIWSTSKYSGEASEIAGSSWTAAAEDDFKLGLGPGGGENNA